MTKLPTLYTIDDVVAMFPSKPPKSKMEEFVVQAGVCRDVFGRIMMTDDDVQDMLALLKATPANAEAEAKLAAVTHLYARPGPHDPGYMVIIGDQLGDDEQLYVAWAPVTGVASLLRAVQFGNPSHLAVLHFLPATPSQVDAKRGEIAKYRLRTDSATWYWRALEVNAWIARLRSEAFGGAINNVEADEDEHAN